MNGSCGRSGDAVAYDDGTMHLSPGSLPMGPTPPGQQLPSCGASTAYSCRKSSCSSACLSTQPFASINSRLRASRQKALPNQHSLHPSETSSIICLSLEMEMPMKWDNKTSSAPSQSHNSSHSLFYSSGKAFRWFMKLIKWGNISTYGT